MTMLHIDSCFYIGKTHKVCQDYACHNNEQSSVIVSDGCSSAIDSDFGSRLLTKSAAIQIYGHEDSASFLYSTIQQAASFARALNLSIDSLAATLLAAKIVENRIKVIVTGDGVLVFKDKENNLVVTEMHYEHNAPYYLKYKLIGEEEYFERFPPIVDITETTITPEKEFVDKKKVQLTPDHYWMEYEYPLESTNFLALCSDGLASCVELKKETTSLSQTNVLAKNVSRELFNFKTFAGEFVHRRINRAFKEFEKKNWSFLDDISVGVIANV